MDAAPRIRLFLCGDVMTGRGIDQILLHPVDPVLHEPFVRDARRYVELAERKHGPVPRPVDFVYGLPETTRRQLAEDGTLLIRCRSG